MACCGIYPYMTLSAINAKCALININENDNLSTMLPSTKLHEKVT